MGIPTVRRKRHIPETAVHMRATGNDRRVSRRSEDGLPKAQLSRISGRQIELPQAVMLCRSPRLSLRQSK